MAEPSALARSVLGRRTFIKAVGAAGVGVALYDSAHVGPSVRLANPRTSRVDPIESLEVAHDGPIVSLQFTRQNFPDAFGLRVNGNLVSDDLDPLDVYVPEPGSHYQLDYYGAKPMVSNTYEVVAIVDGQESDENPIVEESVPAYSAMNPSEYWLIGADGVCVPFWSEPGQSTLGIAEHSQRIVTVGGRSQINHVDPVRGYEGTVAGLLRTADPTDVDGLHWRDALRHLKSYGSSMPVRLAFHGHNFPVILGPIDGPYEADESMTFTASVWVRQCGEHELPVKTYAGDASVAR